MTNRSWHENSSLRLRPSSTERRCDLCVDGHAFYGGVGVEHGFADCGVGVDGEHQFVDGSFELHDGYGFGDEFCGLRTDDVYAEDFAILGIGNDFDEAIVAADDCGL